MNLDAETCHAACGHQGQPVGQLPGCRRQIHRHLLPLHLSDAHAPKREKRQNRLAVGGGGRRVQALAPCLILRPERAPGVGADWGAGGRLWLPPAYARIEAVRLEEQGMVAFGGWPWRYLPRHLPGVIVAQFGASHRLKLPKPGVCWPRGVC